MGTAGGGIDQKRAKEIHMKTAPLAGPYDHCVT